MVGYLGVNQSLPVVDDAPRCHADGHNLTTQGAAQGVVPHGLAHMLHHARVGAAGDDPRTCRQRVVRVLFTYMKETNQKNVKNQSEDQHFAPLTRSVSQPGSGCCQWL